MVRLVRHDVRQKIVYLSRNMKVACHNCQLLCKRGINDLYDQTWRVVYVGFPLPLPLGFASAIVFSEPLLPGTRALVDALAFLWGSGPWCSTTLCLDSFPNSFSIVPACSSRSFGGFIAWTESDHLFWEMPFRNDSSPRWFRRSLDLLLQDCWDLAAIVLRSLLLCHLCQRRFGLQTQRKLRGMLPPACCAECRVRLSPTVSDSLFFPLALSPSTTFNRPRDQ